MKFQILSSLLLLTVQIESMFYMYRTTRLESNSFRIDWISYIKVNGRLVIRPCMPTFGYTKRLKVDSCFTLRSR